MRVIVPAAVAKINATEEGHTLVDNDELLVMCPHDCVQFIRLVHVIGVSQHFNILVQHAQHSLGIRAIYRQGHLYLLVQQNVNLNSLFLGGEGGKKMFI